MPSRKITKFEEFFGAQSNIVEVQPYNKLAQIYDDVMKHVDYFIWGQFILAALLDEGLPIPNEHLSASVLDCACGTGIIGVQFALMGFDVECTDASADMVSVGRARVEGMKKIPEFKVQRFQDLSAHERFDAVICSYDSINYLTELSELNDFLVRVRDSLKPGGFFVFDICTEYNSLRHFASNHFHYENAEYLVRREAHFVKNERIQENRFWISFNDEPDVVFHEYHRQKVYSISEIEKAIKDSGMLMKQKYGDFSRKQPNRRTLRVHFICKRL